jgi:hypothetical protein
MSKVLEKSHFDPHLNTTFSVHPESGEKVDIELVKIDEHKTPHTEGFSLIFRGPNDKPFGQSSHKVKHPKMGEIDLFLAPIAYNKFDGMYYQAVFNRLIEKK